MKFALSTNWCNRRLESGEAIADAALELGFDELELGFHTTLEQVQGFKARLDQIPVGSIHAFCPVPISAPQGYPELYQLADFDENVRAIARVHVKKNIAFAAEMGADTVVLHAGRVMCRGWISAWDVSRRVRRGRKMVEVVRRELAALAGELERHRVVLALENLPYLEGFPADWELGELCGEWVQGWLDTGHDRVRLLRGWKTLAPAVAAPRYAGMHVNDSRGGDDHLAPGEGGVDFAAFADLARSVRHRVFEPHPGVAGAELERSLKELRRLWAAPEGR